MNLLILALLAQGASTKPVLDRYASYVKSMPVSRWEIQVSSPGVPSAQTTLWLNRRKSLRFDAKWRNEDYSIVEHDGLAREIERGTTTYDEVTGIDGVGIPESRIAGTPGFAFPGWTFSTDFRAGFSPKAQIISHGRQKIAGRTADVIEFIQPLDMGGTFYETVAIAPSGAPIQVSQRTEAPGSPRIVRVWTVQSLTKLAAIPAAQMNLRIPNGFVPYAFDRQIGPLSVGKVFPTRGWNCPSGTVDLKSQLRGKRTLLAMLGQGCAPSQRSVTALDELRAKGVRVLLLSDATSKRAAAGRYYDPAGKKATALKLSATPTFFLVDSSGKVTNLWEGYDPDKREQFEKEVRDAIAGKTE